MYVVPLANSEKDKYARQISKYKPSMVHWKISMQEKIVYKNHSINILYNQYETED